MNYFFLSDHDNLGIKYFLFQKRTNRIKRDLKKLAIVNPS
jgi:hypothetical protein